MVESFRQESSENDILQKIEPFLINNGLETPELIHKVSSQKRLLFNLIGDKMKKLIFITIFFLKIDIFRAMERPTEFERDTVRILNSKSVL